MFIKIVSVQTEGDGVEVDTVYECRKYRCIRREEGIFLRLDDEQVEHEISCCSVYVMNNDGQTIDRLR